MRRDGHVGRRCTPVPHGRGRMMRRFWIVALSPMFAAACSDGNGPTTTTGLQSPLAQQTMTCQVTVASRTMSCDSQARPVSPGLALSAIMGGPQGTYVQLASTASTYSSGTFTSGVTLQNKMSQAMGTTDGTTPDPNGTRIF